MTSPADQGIEAARRDVAALSAQGRIDAVHAGFGGQVEVSLWSTSANILGTATHRRSALHQTVYVWATSPESVRLFLDGHAQYGYDYGARPSIHKSDPEYIDQWFGSYILNPEVG